jgi:hypothetical protein
MGNKQLMYILIGLTTVLIIVGVANLYLMKNQSTEKTSEGTNEIEASYDNDVDSSEADSRGLNSESNQSPPSATQQKSTPPARSKSTAPQSNQNQTTQSTRPQVREFNIRTWVNRSIPLTFESGGDASEAIKKQYAHVVRDLERVQQLLLQEKADEALQLIRPMLNDRGNIYREDAEWYHILALFAAGNNESGFNQLNRLLRDNIHLFYFLGTELQAEMVSIQALIQQSAGKSGTQPKDAW